VIEESLRGYRIRIVGLLVYQSGESVERLGVRRNLTEAIGNRVCIYDFLLSFEADRLFRAPCGGSALPQEPISGLT
jgi:hypothetical protein